MLDFAVSFYSFHPLLSSGELSRRAAMRFARSVGFQGIEMLDFYWDEKAPRREEIEKLKSEATEEAVEITCYTASNDLGIFEEGPWRKEVDRLLAEVETAAALGVGVMRVEATWGPEKRGESWTFEDCLQPVADGLREAAHSAAEAGIRLGLENHGRFAGTPERVTRIIETVDEENFGACIDIGNFLVVDEDPVDSVRSLAPHAVHAHAKDMHLFEEEPGGPAFRTAKGRFLRGAVLGEGDVDVEGCIHELVKGGYRGAVSLEFEGRENLFFGIARGCENLREAVNRLPLRQ